MGVGRKSDIDQKDRHRVVISSKPITKDTKQPIGPGGHPQLEAQPPPGVTAVRNLAKVVKSRPKETAKTPLRL